MYCCAAAADFDALSARQKQTIQARASAHKKRRVDDLIEVKEHLHTQMDYFNFRCLILILRLFVLVSLRHAVRSCVLWLGEEVKK